LSDTENREFLRAELKIVEDELKEHETERDRLLVMRDHYRKRLGLPVAETKAHANVKSQAQSSIHVMTFNKGDFFGLTQAQAAQEVLKRSDGALTAEAILKILQDTGYEGIGGGNPKRTLYVSLARSRKLILVASNTFDLVERRPNVKKARKKSVKKKSKNKGAKK